MRIDRGDVLVLRPRVTIQTMGFCNEFWHAPPCDFLANLEGAARDRLFSIARPRRLRRGQHVFQAGSAGENIYVLKSGRAKIYEISHTGKEVILWFCLPGEIFGLSDLPHGNPREVSAMMYTDAELLVVRRDRFRQFLLEHPDAACLLIDLLSSRMRMLGSLILAMATADVPTRFAKLLLGLLARYSAPCELHPGCDHQRVDLQLTHQELAEMIGTTRQSVSSIISDFKQKGILFVHNHAIYIQDTPALETRSGQAQPDRPHGLALIRQRPKIATA